MLSRRGFLIGTGGLLTMAFVSDARAFIRRKEQEVNMVYRKSDGGGGHRGRGDGVLPAHRWRQVVDHLPEPAACIC